MIENVALFWNGAPSTSVHENRGAASYRAQYLNIDAQEHGSGTDIPASLVDLD
jgi:hypothetical protein